MSPKFKYNIGDIVKFSQHTSDDKIHYNVESPILARGYNLDQKKNQYLVFNWLYAAFKQDPNSHKITTYVDEDRLTLIKSNQQPDNAQQNHNTGCITVKSTMFN